MTKIVTSAGDRTYTYDLNGNMDKRTYRNGDEHNLVYNANNKLESANLNGTTSLLSNIYDGDGTLSYLHSDHLNSANVATDASGNKRSGSDTRYTPFGGTTGGSSMPTDRLYTGQREIASLDLYNYNARYYDPYIGRFIQADTIIPDATDSQDFNRYTYVRNNPLRYTDPSGHFLVCNQKGECEDNGYSVDNPVFTSYDADVRRFHLFNYNAELVQWARNGWITDLDGFVELANAAASAIPDDIRGDREKIFVEDLTSILTNFADGSKYYDDETQLMQSGFDRIFQDPGAGGEQPHHFWFYVFEVFVGGQEFSALGNLVHETVLPGAENKGRSYQDFALGQEGARLGSSLRNDRIDIDDVGQYLRHNLGVNGSATLTWNNTIRGSFNKQFFDLCLSGAALLVPIPEGEYGAEW